MQLRKKGKRQNFKRNKKIKIRKKKNKKHNEIQKIEKLRMGICNKLVELK